MNRQQLIGSLGAYTTSYPEESAYIPLFYELLIHPRAYHRDHLPGHITASAWIVDQNVENTLLLHHKKLDRWLQPGGHADGDEDVHAVAKKEVEEETGLIQLNFPRSGFFDIDIHLIPARPDFPEHYHYDIRYLVQVSYDDALVLSDESHALKWFSLKDISGITGGSASMIRMAEKATHLLAADQH